MHGKPTARTTFPHITATSEAEAPAPAMPPNRPDGVVGGELPAALLREWGPLLKPTGLGLLVALHSFEEAASGHTYYGWAHCTQNALAAYLDTSQDTIARYTNLLQTCGLIQMEEVETPRGKQKLYRVARGLPLPSLALIEHLVFEADTWTRKHTAWLTAPLPALGAPTELTRLTAIIGRAYQTQTDSRGLASVISGNRLTPPGSYLRRREPSAFQPGLLPADAAPVSAPSGAGMPRPPEAGGDTPTAEGPAARSASCGSEHGQTMAWEGERAGSRAPAPGAHVASGQGESARGGLGIRLSGQGRQESATGGVGESAPGGLGTGGAEGFGPAIGTESAPGGVDPAPESAPGGLPGAVNVDRSAESVKKEWNDNDARDPAGMPSDATVLTPEEAEALVTWGAGLLADADNQEWHRRCLVQHGPARYRWAVDATCQAQARGTVGKPGAYFTSLLRKRSGPPGPAGSPQGRPESPPPVPPASVPESPVTPRVPVVAPLLAEGVEEAARARIWQTALIPLRVAVGAEEYSRVLRYAVLVELDLTSGWALLGLPNDHMREQVEGRLAPAVSMALSQACGQHIRVAAAVLPGQGRLAGGMPTLGDRLAERAAKDLT